MDLVGQTFRCLLHEVVILHYFLNEPSSAEALVVIARQDLSVLDLNLGVMSENVGQLYLCFEPASINYFTVSVCQSWQTACSYSRDYSDTAFLVDSVRKGQLFQDSQVDVHLQQIFCFLKCQLCITLSQCIPLRVFLLYILMIVCNKKHLVRFVILIDQ